MNAVLDPKDQNKDNQLTKDEFIVGETNAAAAAAKFDEANTNSDRVLTKSEIKKMLGL